MKQEWIQDLTVGDPLRSSLITLAGRVIDAMTFAFTLTTCAIDSGRSSQAADGLLSAGTRIWKLISRFNEYSDASGLRIDQFL